MELGDIPQVMEIEQETFPQPWSTAGFRRELQYNSIAHYLVAYQTQSPRQEAGPRLPPDATSPPKSLLGRALMSLKRLFITEPPPSTDQFILGYAGLWLMANEAHLTTIAVRESYRRRGIGELLLISAIDLAVERSASVMTLEVRASNLGAQALYEKYGFNKVGVRRGYYTDNHEDAIIMTTDRITAASYQSRFQRLKKGYAQRWGLAGTSGIR